MRVLRAASVGARDKNARTPMSVVYSAPPTAAGSDTGWRNRHSAGSFTPYLNTNSWATAPRRQTRRNPHKNRQQPTAPQIKRVRRPRTSRPPPPRKNEVTRALRSALTVLRPLHLRAQREPHPVHRLRREELPARPPVPQPAWPGVSLPSLPSCPFPDGASRTDS